MCGKLYYQGLFYTIKIDQKYTLTNEMVIAAKNAYSN